MFSPLLFKVIIMRGKREEEREVEGKGSDTKGLLSVCISRANEVFFFFDQHTFGRRQQPAFWREIENAQYPATKWAIDCAILLTVGGGLGRRFSPIPSPSLSPRIDFSPIDVKGRGEGVGK